ncbi:MAG TPA: hypothetical protein VGS22_13070 [Thermoanaerobaculia bacterium]|jgi:hypothetical protein|nr:hypothetical protein [Thermoanaerobaculia bacterium]
MGLLTRYPALKAAVANQYQAILAAGAVGFSVLMLSPLPLLLFAGVELMVMPMMVDRIRRRLEIEKKYADRNAVEMSQKEQYDALPAAHRARFERLRQLVGKVQANYKGLSVASQGIVAEQEAKFDVILAACLKRLWLLQKYDEMQSAFDEQQVEHEIAQLRAALAVPVGQSDLEPRVREAIEKNLEIKEQLIGATKQNVANRRALDAEIDSLESLLQLLFQKSVAATDAAAFTLEIDDVLQQVQADAASVEEMERLLGSLPDLDSRPRLSQQIKQGIPPPPPPPPQRVREGRR